MFSELRYVMCAALAAALVLAIGRLIHGRETWLERFVRTHQRSTRMGNDGNVYVEYTPRGESTELTTPGVGAAPASIVRWRLAAAAAAIVLWGMVRLMGNMA
jgi:hypothetical protein